MKDGQGVKEMLKEYELTTTARECQMVGPGEVPQVHLLSTVRRRAPKVLITLSHEKTEFQKTALFIHRCS